MSKLLNRKLLAIVAAGVILAQVVSLLVSGGWWTGSRTALAFSPGTDAFQRTWERTDLPVQDGLEVRTWMWGPQANSEVVLEPYDEAPGGFRRVQYFDKSRMEDNSYRESAPWDVTNGLLVKELVTGSVQVGDNRFVPLAPAEFGVAGDPDDVGGPTYAAFQVLMDLAPLASGATITQTVDRDGQVGNDPTLARYGVTAAYRVIVPDLDHQVASVFLAFMRSQAGVWEDGALQQDRLFLNDFYATGYPIAEAYWSRVKVAGEVEDVLVQCFERRCLTYTPSNDPGWEVESSNVGSVYKAWVDSEHFPKNLATPTVPPKQTATATRSVPTASPTATATRGATNPTATRPPAATRTPVATATKPAGGVCEDSVEAELVALINDYRRSLGLKTLVHSVKLHNAAEMHSLDMTTRKYFSHNTPAPLPAGQLGPKANDRMRVVGYDELRFWAENIAYYTPSAEQVFEMWRRSPGHNANMIDARWTQIGIGYVVGSGQYPNMWTAVFSNGTDTGVCN